MFIWAMFGVLVSRFAHNCFNEIVKMESKIGFEMSLFIVEAIRGRCASVMLLTATVLKIYVGQVNSTILVVYSCICALNGNTFVARTTISSTGHAVHPSFRLKHTRQS